jgi:hypothetical protein
VDCQEAGHLFHRLQHRVGGRVPVWGSVHNSSSSYKSITDNTPLLLVRQFVSEGLSHDLFTEILLLLVDVSQLPHGLRHHRVQPRQQSAVLLECSGYIEKCSLGRKTRLLPRCQMGPEHCIAEVRALQFIASQSIHCGV